MISYVTVDENQKLTTPCVSFIRRPLVPHTYLIETDPINPLVFETPAAFFAKWKASGAKNLIGFIAWCTAFDVVIIPAAAFDDLTKEFVDEPMVIVMRKEAIRLVTKLDSLEKEVFCE
jgi:hypothetical protein